MEITDDSVGAATDLADTSRETAADNGLRGLAERVETLGGRYEAGPFATGGFRLGVSVPLEQSAREKPPLRIQLPVASPVTSAATAGERGNGQMSV